MASQKLSLLIFFVTAIFHISLQDDNFQRNGDFQYNPNEGRAYPSFGYDMYRNAQMLQPYGAYSLNSTSNPPINPGESSVVITVQLKEYLNQDSRLPAGMTCICPREFSCSYLQGGNVVAKCQMSFTVLVSSQPDSVRYVSSGFLPLLPSGVLDTSAMTPQQISFWNDKHEFRLRSKPSAIDIFVHHLGVVIDSQTGELSQMLSVVHADTFAQPLTDEVPSIGSVAVKSARLQGMIIGTSLTLEYSVQCAGSLRGPNCDFQCNASSINSAVAICRSNSTGFYHTCSYVGGAGGQVQNCKACPWGVAEDSYCRDLNGGVLDPSTAQVVPLGFRTATIVLGIACGILLVLLIIVTIYSCVLVNRKMHEEEAPGHNYRSSLRAEGNANRPLLQASYTQQSPSPQNDSFQRPPAAAPRNIPSLDAVPGKSSLRKTNYIPPAHLGGGSSINDTLNSSFSSSVPMPPSREADV